MILETMKMAIQDGVLVLADMGDKFYIIKEWSAMRWDKRTGTMRGPASLDNLIRLSRLVKLPDVYQKYLDDLQDTHQQIEVQRLMEDPKPIAHYPVKANLYKHQLRGANMAMLVFGVDGRKDEQQETQKQEEEGRPHD